MRKKNSSLDLVRFSEYERVHGGGGRSTRDANTHSDPRVKDPDDGTPLRKVFSKKVR